MFECKVKLVHRFGEGRFVDIWEVTCQGKTQTECTEVLIFTSHPPTPFQRCYGGDHGSVPGLLCHPCAQVTKRMIEVLSAFIHQSNLKWWQMIGYNVLLLYAHTHTHTPVISLAPHFPDKSVKSEQHLCALICSLALGLFLCKCEWRGWGAFEKQWLGEWVEGQTSLCC